MDDYSCDWQGDIEDMTTLEIKRDEKKRKIWSHVRNKWLVETPEETVRQEYLLVLVNDYGFALDQIAEEMDLTGRGSASARADFVIWRTVRDKADNNAPFIIVECKSDNVTIKQQDYGQGEKYARICGAPFFVTHNSRETKYWRVKKDKVPGYTEEIENIPHADATDREIEELISKLRVFKEREFADLLHQCHNVIRNREKKDPAAAFDEIAKILFVKVYVERKLLTRRNKENLFTVDVLNRQIAENPLDTLFQETKKSYSADKIFDDDERINLKPATGEEIVRKLEKYNLSDTSEDIKGVAFERFLGRTFRGEIGQFFTPRTIVEFMVHMIDPQEGEVVCDPASGSGGFLIRVFEIVRERILADADRQYNEYRVMIEDDLSLIDSRRAKLLHEKYNEIQRTIDQTKEGSRLWNLANRCILGTDANDRMARTSKMNMIMHGDGHGGVHHHDGFLNVNGIFENRFDIVLTNPPFGANVEPSDKVLESDIEVSSSDEQRYVLEFGELYKVAQARVKAATNKPIASLFDLPKRDKAKTKTEILFIERCLNLLKPGGRMGIVLPEGVFNNPSLSYVRQFVEDRAYLLAVVSLPEDTFVSSGTTVKASLLFLRKYTEAEKLKFENAYVNAKQEIENKYADKSEKEVQRLEREIKKAKEMKDKNKKILLQKELRDFINKINNIKANESRILLKNRFNYSIFMYEAEKVGMSATGEEDQNELYPNPRQPEEIVKTCLEQYKSFLKIEALPSAHERILGKGKLCPAFCVDFSECDRWDPISFCQMDWKWPKKVMQHIGTVLEKRQEQINKGVSFNKLQPVTIHFDGSMDKRNLTPGRIYSMQMYKAEPDDIIVSKIDLKNGAVGIVPNDWTNVAVTGHFAVYSANKSYVYPEWIHRIIQQPDFKEYLWRNKVGAEGRKEVKLDFFESIEIPIPDLDVQAKILHHKQHIIDDIEKLRQQLVLAESKVNKMIHGELIE